MSILLNTDTNVLVQGITGRDGSFHAQSMQADGTKIVAGVTPGKGGQKISGIPVYNSIVDAQKEHRIDASVIFVPALFAGTAIKEAADASINLIICITEGIPVLDMIAQCNYVRERGLTLIGPNCPGLISPGKSKIGIMPARIHTPGKIGVISRSGTLTYEVVYNLTKSGIGQSTCVGIGGDPIIGSQFTDILARFEQDTDTNGVILIGEIGGNAEEQAAQFIAESMTKPVVAFISGRSAPPGKRMGHAGAIVLGNVGSADSKIAALRNASVPIADRPDEIPGLIAQRINDTR